MKVVNGLPVRQSDHHTVECSARHGNSVGTSVEGTRVGCKVGSDCTLVPPGLVGVRLCLGKVVATPAGGLCFCMLWFYVSFLVFLW